MPSFCLRVRIHGHRSCHQTPCAPHVAGKLEPVWTGVANAVACGVMLSASFDLLHEGAPYGALLTIAGMLAGAVFVKWVLCGRRARGGACEMVPSIAHLPDALPTITSMLAGAVSGKWVRTHACTHALCAQWVES